MTLFNEDESWTDEGIELVREFTRDVKSFLARHPEHSLRQLNIIMNSAVDTEVLSALIFKRLK